MSEECERERIRGLPGQLPSGERILWRGGPNWQSLAWRVFHVRETLVWFALVGAVRVAVGIASGVPIASALWQNATLLPICLAACAILAGVAWASARTTIYTVTDKRVVMRIGIALPLTVNIPYTRIASAFVRLDRDGAGDVGLVIGDGTRLAWFVLWPHCRPWHLRTPEPVMRAVTDGARLANILSDALSTAIRAEGNAVVRTEVTAVPGSLSKGPAVGSPDTFGAAT